MAHFFQIFFLSPCLIPSVRAKNMCENKQGVLLLLLSAFVDTIITCCSPPVVFLHSSSDVNVLFTWSVAAILLNNTFAKKV